MLHRLLLPITLLALCSSLPLSSQAKDSAGMYTNLIIFEYEPSERDPFVSPVVTNPLVLDDEFLAPEAISVDRERLREIITQLQNYIKSRIRIQGVSFEKNGSGYAIARIDDAETNQVIRPGQYLLLPSNSDADRAVIQTAAQMAADAGEAVEITTFEDSEVSGILIPIRSIREKTIELETPIKSKNITDTGIISIPFNKALVQPKRDPQPKEDKSSLIR